MPLAPDRRPRRLRTRIAITALAAPIFLTACTLEAHAQDAHPGASPQTETSAAPDCPEHDPSAPALPPQEELARDIRTIVTGEKSPVQQEALTQAARIARGQMSDDLREVLVDAAAFAAHLPEQDSTGNAHPDSLSRLLLCALQPHFSQEELTADILSIARSWEERERLESVRQARQETAALLAMHIPPGEMGETLQRAVVRGMLGIGPGAYHMYTAWDFLSEALSKQYAGYSDADLAAEIRAIRTEEKDIYAPLMAIYGAGRWNGPGFGYISAPENIGPEARAAMIETLAWLNEKINERAWLLERLEAAGDKDGKKALETNDQEQWRSRRVLRSMLADAVKSLQTPEAIEALANAGALHLQFWGRGNRSVVPIVDVLSGERLYSRQVQARLISLTDIVRFTPLIEPLSPENRDLVVRTAHRFLDREGLKDFQGLDDIRRVFFSAVELALALDEPDLTKIVETLASDREELIARGVTPGWVEYFQESIESSLRNRLRIKDFQDPFSEPELPQDELVAAIRAIMEGEEEKAQFRALRQVARMEPEQIGDSLRAVLKKTFLYKYDAAMQRKEAGADFDFYNSYTQSYHEDEGIMYPLEEAVQQLRDPSLVKFFVRIGRYGVCGNEPGMPFDSDGIFSQFPDTSAVLLTEAISPTTTLRKMEDGLTLLSQLAVWHKMGRLRFSRESRALLIATGRRFLETEFLSSLPMQDATGAYPVSRSGVLREAIRLAIALDDPGLIEIVEALATDPDRVTALGIPDEEMKNAQETARRLLSWRPYMGISDC